MEEEKLISTSSDGIVIIWKFLDKIVEDGESRVVVEKIKNLPKIPEMLVAQSDIEVNLLVTG